MPRLPLLFDIEREPIQWGPDRVRLLDVAVNRWAEHYDSESGSGSEWYVLYEMGDGRFVFVRLQAARQRRVWQGLHRVTVWSSGQTSSATEITAEQAVRMLLRGNHDVPAHLDAVRHSVEQALAPRPLSFWKDKAFLLNSRRTPAHTADVLELAELVVTAGIAFCQSAQSGELEKRTFPGNTTTRFAAALHAEFTVEPGKWWGSDAEIPPTVVGLTELPWPAESSAARAVIRRLHERISEALLAAAIRQSTRHSLGATPDERREANTFLLGELPFIKAQILALRRELQTARNRPAEAPEQIPIPVKRPSDDSFRIYRLSISTGQGQARIAELFRKATGRPMSQGQVSRHLKWVKDWLDAGNHCPELAPLAVRKITPVDPAELDKGARRDGRTPRQRKKADDE